MASSTSLTLRARNAWANLAPQAIASKRRTNSQKVLCIVTLYSKYTRALTSQNAISRRKNINKSLMCVCVCVCVFVPLSGAKHKQVPFGPRRLRAVARVKVQARPVPKLQAHLPPPGLAWGREQSPHARVQLALHKRRVGDSLLPQLRLARAQRGAGTRET